MRFVRGAVVLCACVGAVGCGDQVLLGGTIDGGSESAPATTADAGVDAMPAGPDAEAGIPDTATNVMTEAGDDATADQAAPEAGIDVTTDGTAPEASTDATVDQALTEAGDDATADQTVTETGTGDATVDQTTGDDGGDAGTDAGAEGGEDAGTEGGTTFTIPAGKVCTPDGWCWEHPLPQGNWLQSVWGTASDNVWAVGPVGTLLHFDGSAWSGVVLGPADQYTQTDAGTPVFATWPLRGLGGSAANDVWAVGNNRALHFDGSAWSATPISEPSVALYAVGSNGPSDAWAVGNISPNRGLVMHWDGTSWSRLQIQPDFTGFDGEGLWVSGTNDVWVCARGNTGNNSNTGIVIHYNGRTWSTGEYPTPYRPQAMWGTDAGVWVAGGTGISSGIIDHFDGTSWTNTQVSAPAFTSLWGTSSTALWAVGLGLFQTTDGTNWSSVSLSPGNSLQAVWMGSASEGWTVGASGAMRHFDGGSWTPQTSLATGLSGVWGAATDDVWLAGTAGGFLGAAGATGTLLHWDGSGLTQTDTPSAMVTGVWGAGSNDVWFVGQGGWIGHRTTSLATVTSGTTTNLDAISGTGSNDIWAVGDGSTILHKDASGWSTSYAVDGSTVSLRGVYATSSTDAWAVGDGTVLHWNGTNWSSVSVPAQTYYAVWAAGASDVWVGGNGGVMHWDGANWTSPPGFPPGTVMALGGASSNDVWAAGSNVMHWDGNAWSLSNAGTTAAYTMPQGVWTLAGESWIVGQQGLAVHRSAASADAGTARCAPPSTEYFVDPANGSDTGTGAPGCPLRTITRAIQMLPAFPLPGTRIIVLGPATISTGETFPLILPSDTVLTTQGGAVAIEPPVHRGVCPMGNGVVEPAAVCLASPRSGIQGGAGAPLTIGHPFVPERVYDEGLQVFKGADDSTFLENVTIHDFCYGGITVNGGRLTIRGGVSSTNNLGYGIAGRGHVTIDVPAGQPTTSFSYNSDFGIATGGVDIRGVPGTAPGTGTVVVHDNYNALDCNNNPDLPYQGPYAGLIVESNPADPSGTVTYGTTANSVVGLVSYGNRMGINAQGGSNLKVRGSVLLDPVGVMIQRVSYTMPDGGVGYVEDLSRIDLGTTAALPEGGVDYGYNVLTPQTDAGPGYFVTGICLNMDPDAGTLNAAGNVFPGGRDCSGTSPGRLSVSSQCFGDLGIFTYTDAGYPDAPTDDAGGYAGNYINAANCTQ
jgi:hypothetical protein